MPTVLTYNRTWSGYHDVALKKPLISVRPPSSNATNTLAARVTGEKQFVKAIGVYDASSRKFLFEIPVGQNGEFKSRKVRAGNYKLQPLPGGKFDLICSPREKRVMCRENQTKNADFHITVIFEG